MLQRPQRDVLIQCQPGQGGSKADLKQQQRSGADGDLEWAGERRGCLSLARPKNMGAKQIDKPAARHQQAPRHGNQEAAQRDPAGQGADACL